MYTVAISACLLGEPVRYDGTDKKQDALSALSDHRLRFLPFCPETGCGLGVPREPMQLEGEVDRPRLRTQTSRQDHTDRLNRWSAQQLARFAPHPPVAFIFKSRSPSCGLTGVKIMQADGTTRPGQGLFARQVQCRYPHLPLVEEGDLADEAARQGFLDRLSTPSSSPDR